MAAMVAMAEVETIEMETTTNFYLNTEPDAKSVECPVSRIGEENVECRMPNA